VAKQRPKSKQAEKALKLRSDFWPELNETWLWHRKRHDGYTTIPRTIPLMMNIIDSMSKNKPAGRTYLGLWCRAFDESLVVIENPQTYAFEAGFTGERAATTWKQRMASLKDMGFIDSRPGSSGDFHYVLIYNPHKVVFGIKDKIQPQMFMQLNDRAIDIGATDLSPPVENQDEFEF